METYRTVFIFVAVITLTVTAEQEAPPFIKSLSKYFDGFEKILCAPCMSQAMERYLLQTESASCPIRVITFKTAHCSVKAMTYSTPLQLMPKLDYLSRYPQVFIYFADNIEDLVLFDLVLSNDIRVKASMACGINAVDCISRSNHMVLMGFASISFTNEIVRLQKGIRFMYQLPHIFISEQARMELSVFSHTFKWTIKTDKFFNLLQHGVLRLDVSTKTCYDLDFAQRYHAIETPTTGERHLAECIYALQPT